MMITVGPIHLKNNGKGCGACLMNAGFWLYAVYAVPFASNWRFEGIIIYEY